MNWGIPESKADIGNPNGINAVVDELECVASLGILRGHSAPESAPGSSSPLRELSNGVASRIDPTQDSFRQDHRGNNAPICNDWSMSPMHRGNGCDKCIANKKKQNDVHVRQSTVSVSDRNDDGSMLCELAPHPGVDTKVSSAIPRPMHVPGEPAASRAYGRENSMDAIHQETFVDNYINIGLRRTHPAHGHASTRRGQSDTTCAEIRVPARPMSDSVLGWAPAVSGTSAGGQCRFMSSSVTILAARSVDSGTIQGDSRTDGMEIEKLKDGDYVGEDSFGEDTYELLDPKDNS
ncbi:unnamed protein product [Calypogeia fissa]